MKRTHLFFNPESETYFAGAHADADPEWVDVTSDKAHEKAAILQGEWVGSNPLPRDLCLKASEHGEQAALFCWAAAVANAGICPDLRKMYAIPNGGKRDTRTAAMLKSEGVRTGVPDVCLPKPMEARGHMLPLFGDSEPKREMLCGIYIEMKKVKVGSLSPEQKERIADLRSDGYAAVRCNGWLEAKAAIVCYMGISA